MITFDGESGHFNYRAVAIVIEDGRVLLCRAEREDFWYLPGGRVELHETARESLAREMREELGVEGEIGRLVWVVENFFEFNDRPFHEIGFYFEASLREALDERRTPEFERLDESGTRLLFRWAPLHQLATLRVLPAFFTTALADPPAQTAHIVWRDERPFGRA